MAICNSSIGNEIVSQLPASLFLSYENVIPKIKMIHIMVMESNPQCANSPSDSILRAIIARFLRQFPPRCPLDSQTRLLLLVLSLNEVTPTSLDLSEQQVVLQLIKENPTDNVLDCGVIILSQMMTHLPADIRNFLSTDVRLDVFTAVMRNAKQMGILSSEMGNYGSGKESFTDVLPTDLVAALSENFINTNSINSMNPSMNPKRAKFASVPMDNYAMDQTLYEILSPGYPKDTTPETVILPQNMNHVIRQVEVEVPATESTAPQMTLPTDMATYVDTEPTLLLGVDKQYYYYDTTSGTISEVPLETPGEITISKAELESLLRNVNIDTSKISGENLDQIKVDTNKTNENKTSFWSENSYLYWLIPLVILVILIIATGVIYFARSKK